MKNRFSKVLSFLFFLLLVCSTTNIFAYAIIYKEQYYKLFHTHYNQSPDNVIENIYWLEKAAASSFANPRYALAQIENKTDWEKYRYLFMMHVNLKLIEQHLRLGKNWDKQVAYFYDAPWKEQYLYDLETAKTAYTAGLYYWNQAQQWVEKANDPKFKFLFVAGIQNWEDELYRINEGLLDYEKIINRQLTRIEKVMADFNAMDENTY
ncbi:MAG: hypothetical protein ACRC5H_03530 [Treponemataceae bacterium]